VRCFASLFYTYRKFLGPATGDGKKAGNIYRFNMEGFLKSMPPENSLFIQMLEQTQAFSEFIHDRESKKASDPAIKLFDEVILSKKNRGKSGFFSRSSKFLVFVPMLHLGTCNLTGPALHRNKLPARHIRAHLANC
jgi:hypothetical protein